MKKPFNPADNFKGKPGPGRPPGSKDKVSRNLKQLVLDTVESLERQNKSLAEEAEKDPKWFFQNFVKPMLPKEIDLNASGDLTVIVKRFSEEE